MDELRTLIEREAVDLVALADGDGRPSIHTLRAWVRGAVPKGAPPFPRLVTELGRTGIWCRTEADAWITAHWHDRP